MYPRMIADAEAENNAAAARSFRFANAVEKIHAAALPEGARRARQERRRPTTGSATSAATPSRASPRRLPDLRGEAPGFQEGRLSAAPRGELTGPAVRLSC